MIQQRVPTVRAGLAAYAVLLYFGFCPTAPLPAGEEFPFTIPGLESQHGATDLSALTGAIGVDGPVRIRDGHFTTAGGKRLRLLGVNFSFGANFPEHDDADRVAAHLASLGVNAVRHHHMDAHDIWRRLPDGTREVDPEKLEKLAYLISRLARHGVYSNINLHVSRSVTPEEGFPDADLLPRYNKFVLYIDERLQGLLEDYARTVLGYRSPHTGRRLADEPSLVTVEITNENRFTRSGMGTLASLPERYREEFRRRWNDWLEAKYTTTARIQEAWGGSSEPLGGDIADFGDFSRAAGPWSLSARGGSRARLVTGEAGPEEAIMAARVAIDAVDGTIHHLELARGGLSLEEDRLYTVSFWIRAAGSRKVYFDVSHDGDPWRPVGIQETIEIGKDWRKVERGFRATAKLETGARWIFKLGDDATDIWVAGPRLRRGGEIVPLGGEHSLEDGTIPVPRTGLQKAIARDLRGFMEDTERAFFRRMRRFLEEEVGVKAPITGSQARWQALSAFEPLDFVDAHAYWEHPRFPRRSWDQRDWNIPNRPMVRSPGNDALTPLAWFRVVGRPFTVSEYNHPAPNDYQIECVPLLCTLAALQDWDGVYVYSYQHGAGSWGAERIQSFFDINGNPAKLALLATGAMLFRRADLAPAKALRTPGGEKSLTRGTALVHRVGTDLESEAVVSRLSAPEQRSFSSDTGQMRWLAEQPSKARLLVDTPRSKMALGYIAEDEIRLSGVSLATGPAPRDFGVISLLSLDGKPVAGSGHLLLTTLACAENTGLVWNEDRTSVSDRWGRSPPLVWTVPVEVRLEHEAAEAGAWKAFPLEATGRRREGENIEARGGVLTFRADPAHETVWYELVRG